MTQFYVETTGGYFLRRSDWTSILGRATFYDSVELALAAKAAARKFTTPIAFKAAGVKEITDADMLVAIDQYNTECAAQGS